MNVRWWIHRVIFLRWWTGCGGEGYVRQPLGPARTCYKTGCH